MHDDIRSFVENLPVFDVHEHHMPDILGNRDFGLLELLWQSYGGWTQARPYPLASETGFDDASYGDVGPATWQKIDNRYFHVSDAQRLARKIFSDNATAFFGWDQSD